GHVARAEPFARDPCVRPQLDALLLELLIERVQAVLEPGALDRDPQATEAALEQLLVRELFPGVFLPAGHGESGGGLDKRLPDRVTGGWPKATMPRLLLRAAVHGGQHRF